MDSAIEEIKKKIDIIEYLGSYLTLKKAGRNFKAVCPFHNEKTPSFVISPDRQIWHCFGACHDGGDIIKFLMKWENITFFEALKELAQKAGVKLPNIHTDDAEHRIRERLLSLNSLATEYFEYILHKTRFGKKGLDYLAKRGINQAIMEKFQIGYAADSWDSLKKFLLKKKYTNEEILSTGMAVKGNTGKTYDRFRGRLMFPIKDTRGVVVGFSGRILESDEHDAKYVNTPETLLYHKRETLFGIDLAKEAIRREKNVILVEGEFDMITPYQEGIENIVAIKGSAVTNEQLQYLKRYTERLILCLDTDEAGVEAIKKTIELAEPYEFEVEVASFDFAKDPDEAVHKNLARFKKTLKEPLPIYDFVMAVAEKEYPPLDAFNKKRFGEEIIPYLDKIQNPIVKNHYIKKLSIILDTPESAIWDLLNRLKKGKKRTFAPKPKTPSLPRELLIQKYLLSIIWQNQNPYKLADSILASINNQSFSQDAYKKLVLAFWEYKKTHPTAFDVNDFIAQLPAELKPVFDEIYLFATGTDDFSKENFEKLALELKRFGLKKEITHLLTTTDDSQKMQMLNRSLNEVENQLAAL